MAIWDRLRETSAQRQRRGAQAQAEQRSKAFRQSVTRFRLADARSVMEGGGGNWDAENAEFYRSMVSYKRQEEALQADGGGVSPRDLYEDLNYALESFMTHSRGGNPVELWIDSVALLLDLRAKHGEAVPDPLPAYASKVMMWRSSARSDSGRRLLRECERWLKQHPNHGG